MPNKLRVLIVDDEQPARDKLALFLSAEKDFEVVSQAKNGVEALQQVAEYQPEVVFLDIQMPTLDGLSVAMNLQDQPQIQVVFVTGFNDYAIKAFEVNAVDYLLKPYDKGRLKKTINRLRERSDKPILSDSISSLPKLVEDYRSNQSYPERLMFKTDNSLEIIQVGNVEWIESSGNYVKVCLIDNAFIARQTLNSVQSQLDPTKFSRIHRSYLVNIAMVEKALPLSKGDFNLVLKSGTSLRLSRSFQEAFFKQLKA
jgi:two-component system LytT family response regulator